MRQPFRWRLVTQPLPSDGPFLRQCLFEETVLATRTQGRLTMTRASSRSRGRAPLLAAGLLLLAAPLQAGPILVPGQLEGGKFTPAPGVPCHCYTIRFSTSTVTVER